MEKAERHEVLIHRSPQQESPQLRSWVTLGSHSVPGGMGLNSPNCGTLALGEQTEPILVSSLNACELSLWRHSGRLV